MTNKNFVYFKETDKNNNPYDWTITLLNSNGQTKTMNLFLLVSNFIKRGVTHHDLNIVTTEEIMHNIIDVILKNREKYKEEFIELQGEYEYERIYGKEKPKEEEQEEEETEEEYYYYGENDVYDY